MPYTSVHCILGDGKDIHVVTETLHTCKLCVNLMFLFDSFNHDALAVCFMRGLDVDLLLGFMCVFLVPLLDGQH